MTEEKSFLEELEEQQKGGNFEEPLTEAPQEAEAPETEKDEEDPENQPESVKDRRHRRLEAKLAAEREANIALNERLKTLAEVKQTDTEDYLKNVERIYGTDSPEAQTATELLKNALKSVEDRAHQRALEDFRAERAQEKAEVSKEEDNLDSMLDELEDEHGVDLTSTKAESTRKAFFTLLEKMSPKDSNGNIIAYADHNAVYDVFKEKLSKKPENPAKALAARSMTQGASAGSNLSDTSAEQFLKENGII